MPDLVRAQDLEIGGKPYVLVPKADYERLRLHADGTREKMSFLHHTGSIGPEIRLRRRNARLTLSELASRAGIRLETLCRIENGRTNPSVATIQAVLRALEGNL